ncbi:hypothetical protein COCON_G00140510 [Conger conger]|uniref:Uncharacterized protein n=1 Tax=Conger conger TaxID=82655 RepID=A0A9Q1DAJ9_CONCO|nr:hypothetical protein COCON_G00140510 [Conger conger]
MKCCRAGRSQSQHAGERQECNLDRLPVHCRARNIHAFRKMNLICMSIHYGRKPKWTWRKHINILQKERFELGFEPVTFLLCRLKSITYNQHLSS